MEPAAVVPRFLEEHDHPWLRGLLEERDRMKAWQWDPR